MEVIAIDIAQGVVAILGEYALEIRAIDILLGFSALSGDLFEVIQTVLIPGFPAASHTAFSHRKCHNQSPMCVKNLGSFLPKRVRLTAVRRTTAGQKRLLAIHVKHIGQCKNGSELEIDIHLFKKPLFYDQAQPSFFR